MKKSILLAIALFALIALLPLAGDAYWLRLGTTMLMYGVLAMAWNFIGGLAGYPSFASAAFFGLGAYSGAVAQKLGMPMGLAWTFAGALCLMGLNLPVPSNATVASQSEFFFYAMLALTAITFAAMLWATHSKLGFGLRCIQQNESAADMLGVNTTQYKVAAFMLSGAFAGAAGAIYASWVHYIEPPDVFDVLYSVKAIVMVLLGGAGSVFGPLFGAAIFLSLEELVWRNYLQVHTGVLGLMIVLLVLFLPKGVFSLRWPWQKGQP